MPKLNLIGKINTLFTDHPELAKLSGNPDKHSNLVTTQLPVSHSNGKQADSTVDGDKPNNALFQNPIDNYRHFADATRKRHRQTRCT